jgi:hypothetical protein
MRTQAGRRIQPPNGPADKEAMRNRNWQVGVVAALVVTVGIVRYSGQDSGEAAQEAVEAAAHRPRLPASELVAWISEGEEVEIVDHLEAGKLTVIEFTADW